jgi:glycosyltransferase involved in cell wall biosynthesis
MQKIACVFSFQESSWVSCQKIVFNLHEAWSKNQELEIQNFNLSANISSSQNQQLASSVAEYAPDTLIILDHKPHPLTFFESLLPLLSTTKRPKIIFHIFGDFTLYYKLWSTLGNLLKDFDVKFIVASKRQKTLIDRFLTLPMTSEVCPFPVNASEFSYTDKLREAQRAEWGLKEKDIALVFTGRLSRQKRIHTLINLFSKYLIESKNDDMHLFLYGNPDNIGDESRRF